jgi:hypothetical protein
MSIEEAADIKITIKKWMIGSIITIALTVFSATGVVINFYYNSTSSDKEAHAKFIELSDRLIKIETAMQNKVNHEEMKDFKGDMKQEMRDIKNLLNILIEKR